MKKCLAFAAMSALSLQACAPAAPPGTAGAAADTAIALEDSPAGRIALAMRLAELARQDEDPYALLVAARVLQDSGVRPGSLEGSDIVPTVGAAGDPLVTAWANEAKAYAAAGSPVIGMAETLLAVRPKGVMASTMGAGPLRFTRRLDAGETLNWRITPSQRQAVTVAAIGDGDAALDLNVRDGELSICKEARRTYHPMCRWTATAARYDVSLANSGSVASEVVVISN
ncbi:hypothetical protein KCG44_08790 [Pacificimonas sp. WHA3]|uniref:Lipoprotein n=1 Tax=Pacificimonas pallii TaxID=2827236 RepID=A0ABS6SEQ6_9SPHN|nr:hypothetical protein [Pacificimonas pallii]MBV7256880.1 hypothetical protein [Pacificimonas pallii]